MKLNFKKITVILISLCCLSGWTQSIHSHSVDSSAIVKPLSVKAFDETSWSDLLKKSPRPMAYLFTTSYCSTCPEAFAILNNAVKSSGRKINIAAVMMDVTGAQAQRHANHFEGLTQLYAFDGFEPAIRQSVDPKWPNVTPYIVLIDKNGAVQKVIGQPSPSMIKRWLS